MACVMVSILVSSVVDHGFELGSNQRLDNCYLLLPQLSMQQKLARAKTGWLGIRIMCPNGATCLPVAADKV